MDAQSNYRNAEDLCVRVFQITNDAPDELGRRLRTKSLDALTSLAEILGARDPEYALVAICGAHQTALGTAALLLVGKRLGHLPADSDRLVRGYGDIAQDLDAWLNRPRRSSTSTYTN
ncbi:MAG: hypothetical protein GY913_22570 [Proteobacteria bacterium]|nr:hypothetical protein [Pseudomonadota bacterium]MCP4919695.1 hypothetical protein [Pseudomonadota bacterium]